MLKIIKKIIKKFVKFIADFWFLHLLVVFWLTPAILILIAYPELVIVRILLAVVFFFSGMVEGYLLDMEIDD